MDKNELAAMSEHEEYMRRCIELAKDARSQGNTPVGSVVVVDGEIIGEGAEELPAGTNLVGHAELFACQSAVDRAGSRCLDRAALYTTAEPCFMCSYVIRHCRISLVVYGVQTPDVGGITSAHPILTIEEPSVWTAVPDILGGVLEVDCRRLRSSQL